jgi:tetratricopeptide (TPR) repeat protein
MPNRNVKGVIEPLTQGAIPLICWRLRDLRKPDSRIVLASMPTCGNCHSFSNDGRVLGMDMDGPSGDKGAYAVVPVQKKMLIEQKNVMSWNAFHKDRPTFGLFSRVSPDGRFVISGVDESVYVVNYLDFRFLQTFYPTRSILAYYSRDTGQIRTLPGADDPRYVQGNAVWSPDGKSIAFIRALARDNFPEGASRAERANDPNENQIQYDIYVIPFNEGKGGVARPLKGASGNGRSNSFPKYSPDGKWLVYVQAKNGLLMRPDSDLYIIPAGGGEARRLNCNTPLMNSWHSWSPNSRWLVFSSKAAKPFTVMYLTHIDEDGRDSPAILVPNSTAYNRAVNIPEFVNIPPEGIEDIQVPAVEYQIYLDAGEELLRKKEYEKTMAVLGKALELKPEYPKTLAALGYALSEKGDLDAAIRYFRQSLELDKFNIEAYCYLGVALTKKQDFEEALRCFEIAVGLNPMNFNARSGLAGALVIMGRTEASVLHFQKALDIDPGNLDNRYNYGVILNSLGRFAEAIDHFTWILEKSPSYGKAHTALAVALNRRGDTAEAIGHYEEALKIMPEDLTTLNNLAWILATAPDPKLRNGARALELSQKLCSLMDYKQAAALDTLAAAFARVGKFEDAVKWASRSLEMTEPSDPKYPIRGSLLALYKEKKAFPDDK